LLEELDVVVGVTWTLGDVEPEATVTQLSTQSATSVLILIKKYVK
jgi:hypothetical protein